jgi:hypothetical protein
MSKFHDRARKKETPEQGPPAWYQPLAEHLPELASVLAGSPKGPNGEPPVAPLSLIISTYQGSLQFCISRKGGDDMWFGTITNPQTLLIDVEAALQGNLLTYQSKRKKGGFTGQF